MFLQRLYQKDCILHILRSGNEELFQNTFILFEELCYARIERIVDMIQTLDLSSEDKQFESTNEEEIIDNFIYDFSNKILIHTFASQAYVSHASEEGLIEVLEKPGATPGENMDLYLRVLKIISSCL